MKAKPVVKYDNFTFEFCGETRQVKRKLILIAVLKGEEAKAVNRARRDGFILTEEHITIANYFRKGVKKILKYYDK